MAAYSDIGYRLSSRLLGRRRERGTWNPKEKGRGAGLALAMPTQKTSVQTSKGPSPPGVLQGNGERCILQPPPLLPFPTSGDGATQKFPMLTLGQAVGDRSSLWRQFMSFPAVLTCPLPALRSHGPDSVRLPRGLPHVDTHRRTGLLSAQCCPFLAKHWLAPWKSSQQ